MPDFAEVSDTLAGIIAGLFYPSGTDQPSATGDVVTVFPGWPTSACLAESINDGRVQVTIYPLRGEKNTTRYSQELRDYARNEKTITATVDAAGTAITLAGTVSVPQRVAVAANGNTVTYAVQASDTLATITSALAALLVAQGTPASSTGSILSVPSAVHLSANVGVAGEFWVELKRQQKQFMISVWAPDHEKRTRCGKLIDTGLAKLKFLSFPDYTSGLNLYVRADDSDSAEEILLYRRDLVYQIEFPTIDVVEGDEVISTDAPLDGA